MGLTPREEEALLQVNRRPVVLSFLMLVMMIMIIINVVTVIVLMIMEAS